MLTSDSPSGSQSAVYRPPAHEIALISEVATAIARHAKLSPDDAMDFCQLVHLKFLETDYDALRRFNGQSSLKTYLNTVIRRILVDHHRHLFGRWRPSAEALRHGPAAVELERLIVRDGHPVAEALDILLARPDGPSVQELQRLAEALASRHARRRGGDTTRSAASGFVDPLVQKEERRLAQRSLQAITRATARLSPSDREMLHLRFVRGWQPRRVAASLGVEVTTLYRRYNAIMSTLRAALVESPTKPVIRRRGSLAASR